MQITALMPFVHGADHYERGSIIEQPPAVCAEMIRRGLAEALPEEAVAAAESSAPEGDEKAAAPRKDKAAPTADNKGA